MPTVPEAPRELSTEGFHYRSSLAADVWHPDSSPASYEWWYFDALSDDGRDALVVIFLAGFVFSPRYNRAAAAAHPADKHWHEMDERARRATPFPALAFCLYRDGRPHIRAINEYSPRDFDASPERPACHIGASRFVYDEAERRFRINLEEPLRGGRILRASLSWSIVEGDFEPGEESSGSDVEGHEWNLVAPRCRVGGDLRVVEARTGRVLSLERFGGEGYHDHNRDRRWLPAAVASWQWGRAHFEKATAVFYSFREQGAAAPINKLFIVRDERLVAADAILSTERHRRDLFGLRYPETVRLVASDGSTSLTARQRRVVDRSHFYLRFTGEATLELGGVTHRAPIIAEHLVPRALRWRSLDWLTDMRIGRRGRAAFLK
jgi:carotenoid 1,2-hydratase